MVDVEGGARRPVDVMVDVEGGARRPVDIMVDVEGGFGLETCPSTSRCFAISTGLTLMLNC